MYKVMVVDDCEVVRKKINRMKIWGADTGFYIAGEAENGHEALEKLKANPVDLVITDIRMPKIDGIELIRRIKEKELAGYVVLLSDYSEFGYAQDGIKYGAFDYIVKPVREEEFRDLLERVKKQLLLRQCEVEKIKYLEQKLKEKVEVFYPKDHVKQIIEYLTKRELRAVNVSENLVDSVSEVLENDVIKIAFVLQNALEEIWKAAAQRYSWLDLFVDITHFSKLDFFNYSGVSDMKTAFMKVIGELITTINKFEHDTDKERIVKQVCQFVLKNVGEEITLTTISVNLYLNKSYISKLFKQKTDMTVNEYITMVKMERAKRLLEEDDQRNFEVAYKVGYRDTDYFSKLFKKYTGFSPTDYKKKAGCWNYSE